MPMGALKIDHAYINPRINNATVAKMRYTIRREFIELFVAEAVSITIPSRPGALLCGYRLLKTGMLYVIELVIHSSRRLWFFSARAFSFLSLFTLCQTVESHVMATYYDTKSARCLHLYC